MSDKQTEALRLALEALEFYDQQGIGRTPGDKAITAIKEALAEHQWVDAGDLRQLKKGDRVRTLYEGVEFIELTFGSSANSGTYVGPFYWVLNNASGDLGRNVGARIDEETGAVYADRGWKVEVLK